MSDNTPLTLTEISEKLRTRRLYAVSKITGVSYPTLKKLSANDELQNYRYRTLCIVSNYLRGEIN